MVGWDRVADHRKESKGLLASNLIPPLLLGAQGPMTNLSGQEHQRQCTAPRLVRGEAIGPSSSVVAMLPLCKLTSSSLLSICWPFLLDFLSSLLSLPPLPLLSLPPPQYILFHWCSAGWSVQWQCEGGRSWRTRPLQSSPSSGLNWSSTLTSRASEKVRNLHHWPAHPIHSVISPLPSSSHFLSSSPSFLPPLLPPSLLSSLPPPSPPPSFPTATIPAVYHSPGETLLLQEVHFHPHWDAPGRRLWRWGIHCNHSLLYGTGDLATRTSLLFALVVSADELLPILVYLVIVCDIPNWYVS